MAALDAELLAAARLLLRRSRGERGRLSRARVRRSISTAYYALFHFILDEVTLTLIGDKAAKAKRRRILARSLTHKGLRVALGKFKGEYVAPDVAEFVRRGVADGQVRSPQFVRSFAKTFEDTLNKRLDADYDLNKLLTERDAMAVIERVETAIANWRTADGAKDAEDKRVLGILLLLQGRLKNQD